MNNHKINDTKIISALKGLGGYFRNLFKDVLNNQVNKNTSTRRTLAQRDQALRNTKDESVNGVWPASPELRPWFDQSDAQDKIDQSNYSDDDKQLLRQWVKSGFVIKDVLTENQCDDLVDEINNNIWGLKKIYPRLEIIGVCPEGEKQPITVKQEDLSRYSDEQREWMKANNNWRIHGLMDISEPFGNVAENQEVVRVSSLLFGEQAEAGFSLSFGSGSEQTLHQDIAQFNIYPRNYLIGVWIALEDIHEDSGPLMFYPGTHKLGLWEKHAKNYPQTMLRTMPAEVNKEYFGWLATESKKISDKRTLLAKKGQALFWHPCLAHGGSKRNNKLLTRHSYVLHMVPRNKDVDKRLLCN